MATAPLRNTSCGCSQGTARDYTPSKGYSYEATVGMPLQSATLHPHQYTYIILVCVCCGSANGTLQTLLHKLGTSPCEGCLCVHLWNGGTRSFRHEDTGLHHSCPRRLKEVSVRRGSRSCYSIPEERATGAHQTAGWWRPPPV